MSVSKKLRAGLALGAVLASCQLVAGCGDSNDGEGGGGGASGTSNTAGKAGSAQAGKAGMAGHAGSGHAGEAELGGMAGEAEVGGGNEAGGSTGGASGGATAGSGSTGGASGGATAGSGGSNAGSGGAHAGSGGSNAGSGGAHAGGGGASAGGGGASAGTGGASAGSGGASAGSGGASAGSGGASAGTGGASAGSGGSGGSSTAVCGNSIVETGELCDPKLSVNNCGRDCKAITSAACLACETSNAQYGYDQTFITCNTAVGGTTTATVTGSTGAAKPTDPNPVTTPVGTSKSMLCNEVVDCVRDTHCAAGGFPTLSACYCGSVSQGDCNNGLGNGLCKAEIERALETTNFSNVAQRAGQTLYGGGVALSRIDSDQSYCDDTCLPL